MVIVWLLNGYLFVPLVSQRSSGLMALFHTGCSTCKTWIVGNSLVTVTTTGHGGSGGMCMVCTNQKGTGPHSFGTTSRPIAGLQQHGCLPRGWAEIKIRRPTGTVSWVLKVQNRLNIFSSMQPREWMMRDIDYELTLFNQLGTGVLDYGEPFTPFPPSTSKMGVSQQEATPILNIVPERGMSLQSATPPQCISSGVDKSVPLREEVVMASGGPLREEVVMASGGPLREEVVMASGPLREEVVVASGPLREEVVMASGPLREEVMIASGPAPISVSTDLQEGDDPSTPNVPSADPLTPKVTNTDPLTPKVNVVTGRKVISFESMSIEQCEEEKGEEEEGDDEEGGEEEDSERMQGHHSIPPHKWLAHNLSKRHSSSLSWSEGGEIPTHNPRRRVSVSSISMELLPPLLSYDLDDEGTILGKSPSLCGKQDLLSEEQQVGGASRVYLD